jgi:hypothetical protein
LSQSRLYVNENVRQSNRFGEASRSQQHLPGAESLNVATLRKERKKGTHAPIKPSNRAGRLRAWFRRTVLGMPPAVRTERSKREARSCGVLGISTSLERMAGIV